MTYGHYLCVDIIKDVIRWGNSSHFRLFVVDIQYILRESVGNVSGTLLHYVGVDFEVYVFLTQVAMQAAVFVCCNKHNKNLVAS